MKMKFVLCVYHNALMVSKRNLIQLGVHERGGYLSLNTLNIHLLYVLYRKSEFITIYISTQNYTNVLFLKFLPIFSLNFLLIYF